MDFTQYQDSDDLAEVFGRAQNLDDECTARLFFRSGQPADPQAFLDGHAAELRAAWAQRLADYRWFRDVPHIEVAYGPVPHLVVTVRYGDDVHDEWLLVQLVRELTAEQDVAALVSDLDGEILLIESALALPSWLTPENAPNRCWLYRGGLHVVLKDRGAGLSLAEGLAALGDGSAAGADAQEAFRARLAKVEAGPARTHRAVLALPEPVAARLLRFPQLIGVAVDHLPPPPAPELVRKARGLPSFDASAAPLVLVRVRFSRVQYARLLSLRFTPPRSFTGKHWSAAAAGGAPGKALRLGAAVSVGFLAAYVADGERAAQAFLWPAGDGDSVTDAAAKAARGRFRKAWDAAAAAAVLASDRAAADEGDDADDWMALDAADLDRELEERQAALDKFDAAREDERRRRKVASGLQEGLDAESGVEGVDLEEDDFFMPEDEDSDDADDADDPDGADKGEVDPEMVAYMKELDDELGGAEAKNRETKADGPAPGEHVRTDLPPVQLDMSIVSNLLASYSAEHLLAKGPASTLLSNLGVKGSLHDLD